MAAAQAVSPSSEGTCILRPSPSKKDPIMDTKGNVKKTGSPQSSLKNDSEVIDILVGSDNPCIQTSRHLNRARKRKRRNSMSDNLSTGPISHRGVKRRKGPGHHKRNASSSRIILPTNFLHGGNITDPLNLNSMMDENINRALNAVTPSSSPLPPRNTIIDYVTPVDSTDPLGLNNFVEPFPTSNITKVKNRKTKRRKHQVSRNQDHHSANEMTTNSDEPTESQNDASLKHTDKVDVISRKNNRNKRAKQSPPVQLAIPLLTTQTHIRDPIVSPAIPQDTRRTKSHINARHRRRKHGGKQSINDASIQTDSADTIDEKLRCGSEKICHESHFSPVKRRRTHSENLCSNSRPDKDGCSTFFSGFFCDGTAEAGHLEAEKDLQNLLVKPIGSCIKQEDCSQSPAQRYMNSEKMSPHKSVATDVKQETHLEVKSGKQETVFRHKALKTDNASMPLSGTNKTKSKRPYNARFQYGNYNKYYGYRNEEKFKDVRMECLKKEWFKDKDVLDIGCNAGHLTLLIARDYQPRKIVGIDIDDGLIRTARNNIRHYASNAKSGKSGSKFPTSMAITMGPLATPPVETGKDDTTAAFPNNVNFFQGNYVPKKDEILRFQEPEYDVILCMSVSKWVHLNWGDEGLMRLFRRAFKQLRAGGMFILEPQPWDTYASKKKICEQLSENYRNLQIKPDSFPTILTKDIGFAKVEHVKIIEKNSSKGFKRPIQAYYKPE